MFRIALIAAAAFTAGVVFSPYLTPLEKVQESMYRGTVLGVEACTKARASDMFNLSDIKRYCIKRHEANVFRSADLVGRSSVLSTGMDGSIENRSVQYLLTSLTLRAIRYDGEGNESTSDADADVWVLPNGSGEFSASYKEPEESGEWNIDWCEKNGDEKDPKSCKTWTIVDAKGLKF